MLVFYENGDLKGPIDYLNEWNGDKWERAFRSISCCREVVAQVEGILADIRELVQMHSDLLYHPGRTSDDRNEQNVYWNLYYNWYSRTLPRALRSIKRDLDRLWTEGTGKLFQDRYPQDSDNHPPGSVICDSIIILETQVGALVDFRDQFARQSTDRMIRTYLNPTGRGARVLTTGANPEVPAILTLR